MNLSLETIDQFLCYQFSTEYLKSWFIKDLLIIYSSQYGFRIRHSTQHATLEILNDFLSNFDKGQFTFCLFIDLKKAFDTVNYDILLSKLKLQKLWLQRSGE